MPVAVNYAVFALNDNKIFGFRSPSSLQEFYFCVKSFNLISPKRYFFLPLLLLFVGISFFVKNFHFRFLGAVFQINDSVHFYECKTIENVLISSRCVIELTPFFVNYSSVVSRERLFINFMPMNRPPMFAKVNYGDHSPMLSEFKAFEFLRLRNIAPYNKYYPSFFFENGYSYSIDIDYLRDGYRFASPSDADIKLINNLEILPSKKVQLTELRKFHWYINLPSKVRKYFDQNFHDVFFRVKPCHGDLTGRNMFLRKNKSILIDWECFSAHAPCYVDRVGLILYQNFSLLSKKPWLAWNFFRDFDRDTDLLLSLLYLSYVTESPLSLQILTVKYDQLIKPLQM